MLFGVVCSFFVFNGRLLLVCCSCELSIVVVSFRRLSIGFSFVVCCLLVVARCCVLFVTICLVLPFCLSRCCLFGVVICRVLLVGCCLSL